MPENNDKKNNPFAQYPFDPAIHSDSDEDIKLDSDMVAKGEARIDTARFQYLQRRANRGASRNRV